MNWRTEDRTFGVARDSRWPVARKAHLEQFPKCKVCGKDKKLEVHHKIPVHVDPKKELDPSNFMTLCEPHHFLFGHLCSWYSYNDFVDEDCAYFNKKITSRPMKIKSNFVYPVIKESDRTFGVSLGNIINESGDWRNYLPEEESQVQNGVESSACYIESQQRAIATIQEEEFDVPNSNYSARFNALLSNGEENGGDPIRGAKSLKYDGLIPDETMSFKDVRSWTEYHSWKGVDEKLCRQKGKEFLDRWDINFKIVSEREEPLETKYLSLKEALKRSPVPVSVCAWFERNGEYYKPIGKRDNHLTLAVYVDDKDRIHVWDSYSPYTKILEAKTNFEFAMALVVKKKPYEQQLSIISQILALIGKLIPQIVKSPSTVSTKPVTPKISEPTPIKSLREKILDEAKEWIGKEASEKDFVPDYVACAESFCNVMSNVMNFPMITGTASLFEYLKEDKRFKITTDLKAGYIIVSPTTYGDGLIPGHIGILIENGKIVSNSSESGLWVQNYDVDSWTKRYRVKGGFPIVIFEANEKIS